MPIVLTGNVEAQYGNVPMVGKLNTSNGADVKGAFLYKNNVLHQIYPPMPTINLSNYSVGGGTGSSTTTYISIAVTHTSIYPAVSTIHYYRTNSNSVNAFFTGNAELCDISLSRSAPTTIYVLVECRGTYNTGIHSYSVTLYQWHKVNSGSSSGSVYSTNVNTILGSATFYLDSGESGMIPDEAFNSTSWNTTQRGIVAIQTTTPTGINIWTSGTTSIPGQPIATSQPDYATMTYNSYYFYAPLASSTYSQTTPGTGATNILFDFTIGNKSKYLPYRGKTYIHPGAVGVRLSTASSYTTGSSSMNSYNFPTSTYFEIWPDGTPNYSLYPADNHAKLDISYSAIAKQIPLPDYSLITSSSAPSRYSFGYAFSGEFYLGTTRPFTNDPMWKTDRGIFDYNSSTHVSRYYVKLLSNYKWRTIREVNSYQWNFSGLTVSITLYNVRTNNYLRYSRLWVTTASANACYADVYDAKKHTDSNKLVSWRATIGKTGGGAGNANGSNDSGDHQNVYWSPDYLVHNAWYTAGVAQVPSCPSIGVGITPSITRNGTTVTLSWPISSWVSTLLSHTYSLPHFTMDRVTGMGINNRWVSFNLDGNSNVSTSTLRNPYSAIDTTKLFIGGLFMFCDNTSGNSENMSMGLFYKTLTLSAIIKDYKYTVQRY